MHSEQSCLYSQTSFWHRFVEPVPYRNYLVLVTYYLAQWLLFVRSTPYRIKNSIRLMRF